MNKLSDFEQRQFERLGDMIGEGLHLEPDGAWIARDYRMYLKKLGLPIRRPRNPARINAINTAVDNWLKNNPYCSECGERLHQTRSGSFMVKCCGEIPHKFKLKKQKRKSSK